jgi:hypothetical protein
MMTEASADIDGERSAPEGVAGQGAARQSGACLNCGSLLAGPFCSRCGQDARAAVKPLPALVKEAAENLFGLDFKIVATLRLLVMKPGLLTTEFLAGRRQPYTSPIKLYLIISAVAIALMSLTGLIQLEGLLANSSAEEIDQLETVLGIGSLSDPEVRGKFDRRFNAVFPLLNLITPLGLCLALKIVDWKNLLHAHAVFALHLASAQVLFSFVLLPATRLPQSILLGLSLALIAVLLWYFVAALRRVYGGGWPATLLRLVVLGVAYAIIVTAINALAFALILPTL